MQYELRTQVIDPVRHTFQNLIDRSGDRSASRYAEGTVGVQPRENFHYRPLWDPEHEVYDEHYSALRLADPDGFADPRQYYYTPYVAARAGLHEAFGKTLTYLEERDLLGRMPESWRTLLGSCVVPLRHYESGGQLISVNGARFAYGTSVEQCLSFAAFDRIGLAQMLSRVGIAASGGTDEGLVEAKRSWTEAAHLQGLRRLVEELLVESDWATGMLGLDLVDRLLYPLLYRHLDDVALLQGAGAHSLLAQHFNAWYEDQRKWVDALLTAWTSDSEHGERNRAALTTTVDTWLPRAREAVTALAGEADAAVGADAAKYVQQCSEAIPEELSRLGLTVEQGAK